MSWKTKYTSELCHRKSLIAFMAGVLFSLFTGSLATAVCCFFELFSPLIAFFSFFLFFLIAFYFMLIPEKEKLLSPFFYFSCLYFFIPFATLLISYNGVSQQHFTSGVIFKQDPTVLLEKASFFFAVGYAFSLFGFLLFAKQSHRVDYTGICSSRGSYSKFIFYLISSIGLVALAYQFFIISHGSLLEYFINYSFSNEPSGSVITGYATLLLYIALFIGLYNYQTGQGGGALTFIVFFACLFMRFSSGRVFQTLSFALMIVMIIYSNQTLSVRSRQKKTVLICFLLLALAGIIFYSFRSEAGKASRSDYKVTFSAFVDYTKILWDNLDYYALEKGNIPNIPIFMKIIDSYPIIQDFECGESMFWGVVNNLLPSRLRNRGYQISVKVKEQWFGDWPGGALPPTIHGELYANFGGLGVLTGMFLGGFLMAMLKNLWYRFKGPWLNIFYWQAVIGFILILPKGEIDNFPGFYVILLLMACFTVEASRLMGRFFLKSLFFISPKNLSVMDSNEKRRNGFIYYSG